MKASATSVRSIGSKCFLPVFYGNICGSFLEVGNLCTTEEIHSLNGYVDQIWETINTVTGTPIIGANFQLSSVMTQVLSGAVLVLSAAR